jgi:hypothetical protein
MSVLELPRGFHDDYVKKMKKRERFIGLQLAWDILTSPKNLGGVGFRDTKLMNQAMLARKC